MKIIILGAGRVGQVIVGQVAAGQDRVDQRQAGRRAVAHGDGDGAVELDHRRRRQPQQHVVERDDLGPVGRGGVRRAQVAGQHRRPRRGVALAAVIPAFLYYAGLFMQVDVYAARRGLKGLKREELPSAWVTLKEGWY